MDYRSQVLQPNERVKAVGNLHWSVYLSGVLLLALADILVFIALRKDPGERHTVLVSAVIIFVVAIAHIALTWLRCRGTEIVVTNQRVLYKSGIVTRHTTEMNISKIETVDVVQGIGGRLLNYGTLLIHGTGETLEPLRQVMAPVTLRNAIRVG
jgi:uncharacterized membrane protein YdbT with pleckstrin-like domain